MIDVEGLRAVGLDGTPSIVQRYATAPQRKPDGPRLPTPPFRFMCSAEMDMEGVGASAHRWRRGHGQQEWT